MTRAALETLVFAILTTFFLSAGAVIGGVM